MPKRATKFLDTNKASDILNQLASKPIDEKTSIRELLENFHENGFVLAMIFFALPVAIPLPYPPGFTTVMGTPLIILAFQMLIGYDKIHLPSKVNNYQINNTTLAMIAAKTVPMLRTMEQYIKPRFSFTQSVYCEQLVGFMSLMCAISVAIPLPLTNAIPALGIVVMSLGLLNRDGLIVLLGFVVSIIGLLIASSAIIASWIGVKYLFNLIF
jgi:hypothetical protein